MESEENITYEVRYYSGPNGANCMETIVNGRSNGSFCRVSK
ncbi:hypothetical protein [Mycoplasma suis]|uniref:Uncharacterized protein n=1 Tax=Mycoplasma suis (strain KI_3806) TaxID=708248 RepID=F0V2C8_MYCS3|nr:hypothetical protein [Mycoplasma suis]CBZ40809.1 hypothetical protein MSUIS_07160 [Mycoplasma suis KI3806]